MKRSKALVYFGAGGAAMAYCDHSGELPDFFVDNDSTKWGTSVRGIEIMSPEVLTSTDVRHVVITSGYISEILQQLLSIGIECKKIHVPPKALFGKHPFNTASNRVQAAHILHEIMKGLSDRWNVVAGGGAALGFCRDGDFIQWDFDIDLFAPVQGKAALIELLRVMGCAPKVQSSGTVTGTISLESGVIVPIAINFFDGDAEIYVDRYQKYTWEWPTRMFTQCAVAEVHGKLLNVPNPPSHYLRCVYGPSWMVPNPEFSFFDYAGGGS